MNLAEIFTTLPLNVGNVLEKHLETVQVPTDASREVIISLANDAVEATKDELRASGETSLEVFSVLDHVPSAAADHLFA